MSRIRKALTVGAVLVSILAGLVLASAILSPYTTWYFLVPNATLTVDGRLTKGWRHRGNHGRTEFLTRINSTGRESYIIWIPGDGRGTVHKCADWTSPRIPAFPIGDVNPPCSWNSSLVSRRLVIGPRSLEFTAEDGAG